MFEDFIEKSQEKRSLAEKWQDRKSKTKKTRQKNERGDWREESNDISEIPGLPLGALKKNAFPF